MFELSRESTVPLVDQICERVSQLVRHGQLPAGSRLPSIRKLARQVGASAFTVVDAYDRLVARGVIE
jgi:DNA-binding transcriptional regulator YhcF (GntR family)